MEIENTGIGEGLPYPLGNIRDILTAIFKHKIKIFVVFILVFGGIAGYVYSLVPLYEARASLLLKLGREHIFRPEVGKETQIVKYDEDAAVQSEISIIFSKELVRQVVNQLGVEKIYPEFLDPSLEIQNPLEAGVSTFLAHLSANPIKGANVIELSFLNPRPSVSAEALNVLIELLKEKHLQVFSEPRASFLTQQLNNYHERLLKAEEALRSFKQKHDLAAPFGDQQRRLLDQRTQLDNHYKAIKNKLRGMTGKLASLESQMNAILESIPVTTVEEGGNLEKAKADLFALKREEQKLLTKYTESSLPIQNLRKEIAQVEQFVLEEQKSERANTIAGAKKALYNKLEMERLDAVAEITNLEESSQVIALQIRDLDEKVQRLEELNKELIVLDRQRAAEEQNYNLYLNKVEEAKVSEEMDRLKMANISVIQHAEVPNYPAGRSPKILLAIGLVFGLMGGGGFGLLLEYLEGAYTRPDQAARDLNLPLLASFAKKM